LYKVRLKNHNNAIPLNCFGDGIKQVLKIFDTIMRAEDGIICIDEFDSALHTTKMEETIKIIIEACQELNIQMFLTTHNKEALEKVLQASKRLNLLDRVNVIRLRKHPDMTIPYHWDGSNALFELSKGKELRI
jgi:AAA15 family ATPase/GTPase